MLIGIPREIKDNEYRVGLVPSSVRELIHHNYRVLVETNAGSGIGISDEDYKAAGALISSTPEEIFGMCDMIVKVKELQPHEYKLLRPGQILFAYLHLAADPDQAKALINSGCVGHCL